jgi:hypothetical protein
MLEESICTQLLASTAITAIVSTRIYPIFLPQNAPYPAQTYQRITTTPVNSITGYSYEENARIQIDSWATSYSAAKNLGRATLKAMNAATSYKAVLEMEMDDYEPQRKVYRIMQDYSCWQVTT